MQRVIAFTLILIFHVVPSSSQDREFFHYNYNKTCGTAYDLILRFQTEQASVLLSTAKGSDPTNLMYPYLEDYIDLLPVILNEDEQAYRHGRKKRDQRIRKLNRAKVDSPWTAYCLGEIYLRWAIADYKMGREWKAALSMVKAYKLLSENAAHYPGFGHNFKGIGLIEALMGSVPLPSYLKWTLSAMTGINPGVEKGYHLTKTLLQEWEGSNNPFLEELRVINIYINLHLRNRPDQAWEECQNISIQAEESPLVCFVLANVALRSGQNDKAISILETKTRSTETDFPYLDFMLGQAKLQRLDQDANLAFERFLDNYPGASYRKAAMERLNWHEILFSPFGQNEWRQKIKTEGEAITDADREALFSAGFGNKPHPELLRARLLFDGAYYQKALDVLLKIAPEDLTEDERLEHLYRYARIHHLTDNYAQALDKYDQVIDLGAKLPDYYACNAALQSGLIHESRDKNHLAEIYFRKCLSLHPAGYVRSLHMKAKAGLNRIKSASKVKEN